MLGRSDQQLAAKAIEQYKEVLKRGDSGEFPSIMHGIMKRNMISLEGRPGLKYLIESAKDSWTKASSHSAASLQRFYGSLPPTPSGSYTISGSLTHPILSDRSGTLGTNLSSIGSPIPTFSTSGIITTGVVKPTESKVSFSSFSSFVESGESISPDKVDELYKYDIDNFYIKLAERESSNRPYIMNELGYVGLYQMGESALVDAGYYKPKPIITGKKPGAQYNNDWSGEWTGKNGINSLEDFRQNPEVQTKAIKEYHKRIWTYLKPYHHLEGQEIGGVKLTKSGMIAAAHLVGQGNFRNRFLASLGTDVPEDGNKIPCTKYLDLFKGYEI